MPVCNTVVSYGELQELGDMIEIITILIRKLSPISVYSDIANVGKSHIQ